ncbi:hypothetical protein JAAARDRAFT_138341, partial [Jaapia argillacea MUCL 33604]
MTNPTPKGPKLAAPTPFTGDRRKTDKFLSEVKLVLGANQGDFPDEWSKVAYSLSFMKEGTAGSWAMQLLEDI